MEKRVKVLSDTKQEFLGVVYYRCGNYFQRKGKRLHIAVWQHFNGDIPKGYQVHHIDEDRANNQIENLALKTAFMHLSDHAKSRDEYNQRHIKDMRVLASEWHRSEAGRAWHREHAKEMAATREPKTYVCAYCGKEFQSLKLGRVKYCSNACKSNARRTSRIDNETRICAYCGKPFSTNKYSKAKCCSTECAVKRRWGK